MAQLSISDTWDDAVSFLRREAALLLPLGFATFGVALLVFGLIVPEGQQPKPGAWMAWMLPAFLLVTLGYLAVSAVVLRPNISVREALSLAVARLPAAILVSLVLVGAMVALLVVASLVMGVIGAGLGWTAAQSAVAAVALAFVPMLWAAIRLVPLWPAVVDRAVGPVQAVRDSLSLTAGQLWRLGGMVLLAGVTYMLITGVVQLVGGSLFLLLGRAIGDPGIGHMLSAIMVAGVGAVLATVWSVFVACLYRRLAGSSSGT